MWILLKQETVSGSGISWDICKSATRSRQITMPAPHCSVFYRPDALPAAQSTASKHWRHLKTALGHKLHPSQLVLTDFIGHPHPSPPVPAGICFYPHSSSKLTGYRFSATGNNNNVSICHPSVFHFWIKLSADSLLPDWDKLQKSSTQ